MNVTDARRYRKTIGSVKLIDDIYHARYPASMHDPTLKDLNYFVAVADHGTMRAAATECGVSQPTLSHQIGRLEDALGTVLFERTRGGVRLTAAGDRILPHARNVLESVARLRLIASAPPHPLAGPFRLGLIPTIGPFLMPELLPRIQAGYPEMSLLLREERTSVLLERLHAGKLDAAVVALPIDAPSLIHHSLGREPLRAVLPTRHPLSRRDSVSLRDLAETELLLLEEGHCLRDHTLSLCNVRRNPVAFQASSVESLRQMVAAGIGVTVLPEIAVRGRNARTRGIRTRPIASPAAVRELALVFRRTHPDVGALQGLGRSLSEWLFPLGCFDEEIG